MAQGLSLEQSQQVQHLAQLAVLAMCARGVAAAEFDAVPEVGAVVVRISRPDAGELEMPVDMEILGAGDMPMGGMSL